MKKAISILSRSVALLVTFVVITIIVISGLMFILDIHDRPTLQFLGVPIMIVAFAFVLYIDAMIDKTNAIKTKE